MHFKKINLILGWASFAIALIVYLLTLEPSVSLWDCGEFIASSYKLQVGHPPGAPLFMIIGRVFSLFTSDTEKVAMLINAVSAFASAFTILFLFWTISHLLKKILIGTSKEASLSNTILVFGGAFVGAMAYTFSDTFWFSAVEGEVYATSSLFTAVVFWAILKWENVADEPGANRWLILIAYLIGLSIGVHLLNLLAIPAIVLVYYFRKSPEVSRRGVLKALGVSVVLLLLIMYGIIPGIVKLATVIEKFFTNTIGLHYNVGVVIYIILLLGALIFGIYRTQFLKKSVLWNTVLLAITVIVIGYSSYALIVIRSLAGPPMNENRPENVFALLSYLNREQYGDRPLFLGYQYNAEVEDLVYKKPVYVLNKEENKYEIAYRKPEVVMKGSKVLLPRMYSRDARHRQAYQEFASIKDPGNPSYLDNLEFLFRYQVGHMYFRYFMWNFAGRQNDIQGHGNVLNGNWISGIKAIDSARIGPQKNLPEQMLNHPARNTYFLLPLLLGLVGLFFQLDKSVRDFWVVMSLFILTGVAIVIYLNQTPYQPRERDYAFAGSFYAFAIWIGMGVAGVFQILSSKLKANLSAILATIISLLAVPLLMAVQNWDDHDRSGRYIARDIARNYMNSCSKDAVLFTVGDNDTFPLWYVQDVEGVREDVRIINMMLFNMDWYIDQARWKNYDSEPLPFTLPQKKYEAIPGNSIFVREHKQRATVDYMLNFMKSDDPRTKVKLRSGSQVNFIPTHQLSIPVDSATVISNGTVAPVDADRVEKEIPITLEPNGQILKNTLGQLDIIASNKWNRPIYYTSGGFDGSLGMEEFYRHEGLAYRLVPVKTPYESILVMGDIDTDTLYDRLMNKFEWGRMNEEDVHLDYYTIRTMSVIRFRSLYTRLAMQLLKEGQKEGAIEVLDRCMELAPSRVLPFDQYVTGITLPNQDGGIIHHEGIIEAYYLCGETRKANQILSEHYQNLSEEILYFNAMKPRHQSSINREINEAMYQLEELKILLENFQQEDLMLELGISAFGS
jgi:Protein O-mannosyl-transferase TMEM260-like